MAQLTKKEQERVSFLSLLGSASNFSEDPYAQAQEWLGNMKDDGFFSEGNGSTRSSQSSGRSGGRGSSSRSSSSGRGRSSGGGGGMRNPDGPPTDKQVAKVLDLTDEYGEDELYDSFTKQTISDLIDDLING